MIPRILSTGQFSTYLALASFGIGTSFLVAHLLFPDVWQILNSGLIYVILAILLNGVAFLILVYQYLVYPLRREITAVRILILLANIPIAILYFIIVLKNNF